VTATASSPPVRRSALEAIHAAAGARWLSDTQRWPVDYGEPAAEGATAGQAAGLAEIGPLDKLLVRGPDAMTAVGAAAPDAGVWPLGPDEVLLLFAAAEGAADRILAALASADVSVVDVGSAWTVLRLAGPAAPALMTELAPVSVDPRTFAEGSIAQGSLVNVRAIVRRHDAAIGPGYTILVARDEAAYAWSAIVDLGRDHGLRVVGPAAVARANR
jgi:heterotetrameric sarcosine oxidase gamma subunit